MSLFVAALAVLLGSGAGLQLQPSRIPAAKASGSASSKLVVASDLEQRVAKFRLVEMPFDSRGLTARERQMVKVLVDAAVRGTKPG